MDDASQISQANDAFFKEVFGQIKHAREFFESHLPPALVCKVDWDTMCSEPTSFVHHDLRQTHSDLLFSVQAEGRALKLYLLFEHQTSVNPLMPLRMLGYVQQVLKRHVDEHGLPLPPVLGYVLHQGPDKWTVSTQFEDLFELPASLSGALLPYLPKFQHALLDLSQQDPLVQENDEALRIVLYLMKLARMKSLARFIPWLVADAMIASVPRELLQTALLYCINNDPTLDLPNLSLTLDSKPELKEIAMTLAEKLKTEGRQEGRQEGLWVGKLQLLQEMMKVPINSNESLRDFNESQLEQMFRSLERGYNAAFKEP